MKQTYILIKSEGKAMEYTQDVIHGWERDVRNGVFKQQRWQGKNG